MPKKIFVNMPVKDLKRSVEFFIAMGYTLIKKFSDDYAACIEISEQIYAMLLTEAKFKEFTPKQVVDAAKSTEVIICLSADSIEEVNDLVDKALKAGAAETRKPQEYSFMFIRCFNDLDGHIWEIVWMDESQVVTQ